MDLTDYAHDKIKLQISKFNAQRQSDFEDGLADVREVAAAPPPLPLPLPRGATPTYVYSPKGLLKAAEVVVVVVVVVVVLE